MRSNEHAKFNCSLIMYDVVISDGICTNLTDNQITFSTVHKLPQNAACLALISFNGILDSTITIELEGQMEAINGEFNLTLNKDQIGWKHFTNLLAYE